jgi:hypothetical protein
VSFFTERRHLSRRDRLERQGVIVRAHAGRCHERCARRLSVGPTPLSVKARRFATAAAAASPLAAAAAAGTPRGERRGARGGGSGGDAVARQPRARLRRRACPRACRARASRR